MTALIGGAVMLSPLQFPDSGTAQSLVDRLTPPFQAAQYPLGTDPLGRDILARVVVGGRVSFSLRIVSVIGAAATGTLIGLLTGYYRGIWDTFLMRFADIQLALPFILLPITVIAIIGPGLDRIILLMIVAQWVQYARLIRDSVLSLREAEYVQTARSYDLRDRAILFRHILPDAMGPLSSRAR